MHARVQLIRVLFIRMVLACCSRANRPVKQLAVPGCAQCVCVWVCVCGCVHVCVCCNNDVMNVEVTPHVICTCDMPRSTHKYTRVRPYTRTRACASAHMPLHLNLSFCPRAFRWLRSAARPLWDEPDGHQHPLPWQRPRWCANPRKGDHIVTISERVARCRSCWLGLKTAPSQRFSGCKNRAPCTLSSRC